MESTKPLLLSPDSVKRPKAKLKQLFSTKYTHEELKSILETVTTFKVQDLIPTIQSEESQTQTLDYLGSTNTFALTNA